MTPPQAADRPISSDPDWRVKGITITSIVMFDVRETNTRVVWDASQDAMSTNKRSARIMFESYAHDNGDGPIYVHGENLEQIADWLEKAAADVRARQGMPS